MRREINVMNKEYFHVCADGADARNFIIKEADYYAAFNHVAVCAANTDVVVVSFSIEDSHPHLLLWGVKEECSRYKVQYETLYKHYAASTRKGGSELVLRCELIRLAMTLIICGMLPSIQLFNQRKTASP